MEPQIPCIASIRELFGEDEPLLEDIGAPEPSYFENFMTSKRRQKHYTMIGVHDKRVVRIEKRRKTGTLKASRLLRRQNSPDANDRLIFAILQWKDSNVCQL